MPMRDKNEEHNPKLTEKRLKAFILISGFLLFVLIGTAGAIKLTMSPEFCSKCHVMAPEYATWEASAHAQVACVDCHIKPGLGNLIIHKIAAIKELVLYATNTYERPIKMSEQLDDGICVSCHSKNRKITPSGDLIVPHEKHAAKNVHCVECHSGVAHGNIVARKMTVDGNYQVWTAEYGKKQMDKQYTETKMDTCVKCHIKRNVTQECQACHSAISVPQDHKAKTWGTAHGLKARADINYCNKCHSYSVGNEPVQIKDSVVKYARENVFCYDCHQKRPLSHTENWDMTHKKAIVNRDVTNCLVCHDIDKHDPSYKAVPTNCGKCHGQQYGAPLKNNINGKTTFNKLHLPNWRKIHPSIVKEKGAANEGCWNCHNTEQCSNCHMNKLQ